MNGYQTLIDLAVVAGAGLVLPAAMPEVRRGWRVVAVLTAPALALATGPVAGLLALAWPALAATLVIRALRRVWDHRRSGALGTLDHAVASAAAIAVPTWAFIAGLALVDTCAGHSWMGFGEPILRLTVVHFTFAGVGVTTLAAASLAASASNPRRVGLALVLLAPVVTGLGFTTEVPALGVGGPALMTAGVYLVAAAMLLDGWRLRTRLEGMLLLAAGLAPWVPMVLAVAWALAPHTGGPALSLEAMVRIHGGTQSLGFVGCGLFARWSDLPIVVLGRLPAADADRVLDAARTASPTSGRLTVSPDEVAAGHGFVDRRIVGQGSGAFDSAVIALRSLVAQRAVADVIPADAEAVLGSTLLVELGFGPISLVAVNRVVWLVDEPDRWGFAYATLPGHPERGQESFVVRRLPNDEAEVTITGVAHASVPLGRFIGPLVRPVQSRMAERYLDAIGAFVEERSPAAATEVVR